MDLPAEIRKLLKQRHAILLAHNYQRDEVQEIADICGDSLQLSLEASKSGAEVIVFCGVHFMAESAAILSPRKTVLLPRPEAGCPMADMIDAQGLRALKAAHPGAVVVTYVNSSAEVKAESDLCCTSANAVSVVNSVDAGKIIFTPDENLGLFVQKRIGPGKEMILWRGFCPTHNWLKSENVLDMKNLHPGAKFVCHPECRPEVQDLADHICSTSGMYPYVKGDLAREFIIGTEAGILYKMRKENPGKVFHLASESMVCSNMKLITLEDVLASLVQMKHVVTVGEDVRVRAKRALDRMLAVPRDK
jgi:quinolinate synthase